MINVSLVGFGRIGRDLFRQSLDNEEINIVSVSDTADKENLIYLLKYDSIYGQLDHEIKVMDDGILVNDKKTVFIGLPKVEWSAPAFQPNQSKGQVIEFKYSSSLEGDRFNILTDKPVQVAKPFIVKPQGNKGHRLVIDLKPIKIDFAAIKREQLRDEIRHKLLKKTSFKKEVAEKNHNNMLASTETLAMPSEDPPKIETTQSQNR